MKSGTISIYMYLFNKEARVYVALHCLQLSHHPLPDQRSVSLSPDAPREHAVQASIAGGPMPSTHPGVRVALPWRHRAPRGVFLEWRQERLLEQQQQPLPPLVQNAGGMVWRRKHAGNQPLTMGIELRLRNCKMFAVVKE